MIPARSSAADQYLLLRLGTRRCALPCAAVQEILPLPRLWRPPSLPRPLAGFLNLGGEALPVLDLVRLFGLEAEAAGGEAALYRHVVLASPPAGEAPFGLLVDRVLDLMHIPPARLRPIPPENTLNGCAVAEIETEDGFVHLLAPDRLLLEGERARLAALRQGAQARLAEWEVPD